MDNKQVFNKLPDVFQNVTQRKFFDSTFEQLFSKKNSEKIDGFIGRRTSGIYDPSSDYYIPQKNKERTWYQLEPSAVVSNPETGVNSNYYFYYDLINRVRSLGGLTDNHDRLFQSEQYSYAPPVDMDKFVNFQNYYWMPSRFDPINVTGVDDAFVEQEIIGKTSFVASDYAEFVGTNLEQLEFTSGVRVTFPDSDSYNLPYTVRGVGDEIILVEDLIEILPAVTYNALPWDADASAGTVSLNNSLWDGIAWDAVERETTLADYVTIDKGSLNSNLWSRTNKWYHISAIEETIRFTGKEFPASAERARRPIIEFFADIELYNSGLFFYNEIDFYATDFTFADLNLATVDAVKLTLGSNNVKNGTKILFPNDDTVFGGVGSAVNTVVWKIFILSGIVYLVPANYNVVLPIPVELFYRRLQWDGVDLVNNVDNSFWDNLAWAANELDDETGQRRLLEPGGNFVYDNATVNLPDTTNTPIGTEVRVRVSPGTTAGIEAFAESDILLSLNGLQTLRVEFDDPDQDVGFILTEQGWESFAIVSYTGVAEVDDIVFVVSGNFPAEGGNLGQNYYFDGTNWTLATNQKVRQNQAPKFALYDNEKISLDDINKYPGSNFVGSDVFSYKISDEPDATPDPILNVPLVYKSFSQSSDIVFENDLITDRFTYVSDSTDVAPIAGYYYFRDVNATDNRIDSSNWDFNNSWYLKETLTKQRVVDKFAVFDESVNEFPLSVNPLEGRDSIELLVDGGNVEDFDFFIRNGSPWIRINRTLELNNDIEAKTYSRDELTDEQPGYFEIPRELESNAENAEVAEYSYGEFVPHFTNIIFNQIDNQVNPRSRENKYRDSARDPSLGGLIVQTNASMLKSMLFSDAKDTDVIGAIRYAKNEYVNFRNTFINEASRYQYDFNQVDNFTIYNWVSDVIEQSGLARRTAGAFGNSYMTAYGDPTAEQQLSILELRNNGGDSVLLSNVGPGQSRTILDAELPGVIYDYNKIELFDNDAARLLDLGTDYSIERTGRSAIIRFTESSGVTPDGLISVDLLSRTTQLTASITDVTQQNNILYVYELGSDFENNSQTSQKMLLESKDFFVRYEDGLINIDFPYEGEHPNGNKIYYARVFADSDPAYIPATPAKLGMSKVNVPRIEIDSSYTLQQAVIVGHDGSRTLAYGTYERDSNNDLVPDQNGAPYPAGLDITGGVDNIPLTELIKFYDVRDLLLLELEKQIYNNIPTKFKTEYSLLLAEQDIRPSALSVNDYTREEYYQQITESLFSKWTATNRLDFRVNEFYGNADWRTWNYSSLNAKVWDPDTNAIVESTEKLPGSWKGIYTYYYGTIEPHLKPWECLGFTEEPEWWRVTTQAGYNDGFEGYGNTANRTNTALWADIEQGIIRRGPRAGVLPPEQRKLGLLGNCDFDRTVYFQELPDGTQTFRAPYNGFPGPDNIIPVDNSDKVSILDIFNYVEEDVKTIDGAWKYGDQGPVENAWYRTPEFFFSLLEFFYLTKPAAFGEKFWDPESIDFIGDQFVDTRTGFRPVNSNQLVHSEEVNNQVVVRSGYQQYIADYLIFNNVDVKSELGNKIRGLGVQLAHKVGGFTNRDRLKLYLESVSSTDQGSLLVPSNNYDVELYTGAPIKSYTYSGVLVNVNEDSSFTVYGYDLISQEFKFLPATRNSRQVRITEGGTPEPFVEFEFGDRYIENQIVRYEGNFYRARSSFIADSFISSDWIRLSGLPTQGGLSVVYRPDRQQQAESVFYGTRFTSAQEVFDFLIGYGEYLEREGWIYETVDNYGRIDNWKAAAEKFLFWAANNWEENNALALSPSATKITLEVEDGYPDNVERLTNGVYSILDKDGFAIAPENTIVNREDRKIEVTPAREAEGIFYLRVNAIETEHIVIVDKLTDFNDIVYDPVLNTRQSRLRFSGTRTLDWTGKLEAPGYLIQGKDLLPNLDTLAENVRTLYDENSVDDNEDFEDAARHLIGFENRSYLDQLSVVDQAQFNFYQGFVKEKGTANSINKLLRSSSLKDKDKISFFEDWAFKSSDFGATTNEISLEVLSERDKIKSDPQIYRLNFSLRDTGFVSAIDIYSAEEIYNSVPNIIIEPPENGGVQAQAIAVLNSARQLERIEIVNQGSGYTRRPVVTIDSVDIVERDNSTFVNNVLINTDVAYSTVQRAVVDDDIYDQIIDIDSDDKERWLRKPAGINFENSVPVVNEIENGLPTAGYVHREDVDHAIYSDVSSLWETRLADRPKENETIWVASTSSQTWAVYKVKPTSIDITTALLPEAVINATQAEFFETFSADSFIHNNKRYPDCTIGYNETTGEYFANEFTIAITLENPPGADIPFSGEIANRFLATAKFTDTGYQLYDSADEILENSVFEHPNSTTDNTVLYDVTFSVFVNLRFSSTAQIDDHRTNSTEIDNNDRVWVDNDGNGQWIVATYIDYSTTGLRRRQQPLIDTSLYENIYLRERNSSDTIAQIPVYDPVKGILFGAVEKNVSYKTPADPVKYNNSQGRTFGDDEVGKVWLDTSTIRFVDYEQPPEYQELTTGDRSVAVNDAIVYRRDNWGKVFAGSPIDVYEWVESETPPATYRGSGTPKNNDDFIEDRRYNAIDDEFEVTYYFWVKDKTVFPANAPNRTLSTAEIANTIRNPSAQGVRWFAPIQFTTTNQSFIIANAESLLTNRNCVVQLNYRQQESDNVKHDEWLLLRENDRFSKIPDRMWDKMVDSLVGYTRALPADEYENGIPVSDTEVVLPVPATSLSEDQRYGFGIRPQQSMFVNDREARRIITNKLNDMIAGLRFWESPLLGWDTDISSSENWEYVDWYADGYNRNNTRTNRQVESLQELLSIVNTLEDGNLVRVYPFTPNLLVDKYEVYVFNGETNNVELVRREDGAVRILDSIVDNDSSRTAKNELREILDALKANVFVATREVLQNMIFFTAVNFALSEQKNIDWVFKTTYLTFVQDGIALDQDKFFQPDLFDDFLDYVREAKPYHSQIRDSIVIITYESPDEVANGNAFDNFIGDYACADGVCTGGVDEYLRTMTIKIEFSRFGENSVLIDPLSSGSPNLARVWDKVGTLWDQENFVWDETDIVGGIIESAEGATTVYSSEPATNELVYIDPAETVIIDTFNSVVPEGNDYWDINTWDGIVGFDEQPDATQAREVAYKMHIRKYGKEYGEFTANADNTSAELISYLPPSRFVPRVVVEGDGVAAEIFVNATNDNGGITDLEIAYPGFGYTTATATIDHPNGSGFSATLTINNGNIVNFVIDNPGSGYELQFDSGQVNTLEITKEPSFLSVSIENQMWIGAELFAYSNVIDNGDTLIITGVKRGQKGTGVQEHFPGQTVFTGSDFLPDPLLANNGVAGGDAFLTNDDQIAIINRRYDNAIVKIPNCNPWFRRARQDNSVLVANSAAANYLYNNGNGTYPGYG